MFRFSTLRNRLGLLVLLWIVMTLHFVAKERIQFDKPIAGTQLQQKKLAEMITEIKSTITNMEIGCFKK
jgi:hypothetical protein